jgi:organic radical activating enzyme
MCASYNNFVIKEHSDWNLAKDRVYKWAEKVDIGQITIIGGEPFLHPDIDTWVMGVRDAFKDCRDFRILTGLTGDQLLRHKDLILKWAKHDIIVQISVHDKRWWDESIDVAKQIFADYKYQERVGQDNNIHPIQQRYDLETVYGRKLFSVLEQWNFFEWSLKEIKDGIMYMHQNDPAEAHAACKCYDCHYIVDGIMYQCVLTGISNMLVKQLPLDDHSKDLLSKTKGLDPFVDDFIPMLSPCPQCSLCSVNTHDFIPIWPVSVKKPRLPNDKR